VNSKTTRLALVAGSLGSICIMAAAADSTPPTSVITFSGRVSADVAHGNGGTSPLYGSGGEDKWTVNDLISHIDVVGHENLSGGQWAGFSLEAFFRTDNGQEANQSPNTLFDGRATIQFGGTWGEAYIGREYSPVFYTGWPADPWGWDTSLATVGLLQYANYFDTAGIRTNKTVGYASPAIGPFTFRVAVSADDGVASPREVGGNASYADGPAWASVAVAQHKDIDGVTDDRLVIVAGSYDFGIVKPIFSYSSSKVANVSYSSVTGALTAPAGPNGLVRAAVTKLGDWDPSTAGKQGLVKIAASYSYNLSDKTNLFVSAATSKGDNATRTNAYDVGIRHSF